MGAWSLLRGGENWRTNRLLFIPTRQRRLCSLEDEGIDDQDEVKKNVAENDKENDNDERDDSEFLNIS